MAVKKQPREIAITKMVVNLDGKDVTLTIDEARKLCDALTEIFKTKEIIKEVHHHHEQRSPWIWYYTPQTVPLTTGTGAPYQPPYTITCNKTETGTVSASHLGNTVRLSLKSGN